MVLWPIRAHVLFELFYNVLLLQGGNVLVPHGSLRVNLLILRGGGSPEFNIKTKTTLDNIFLNVGAL